MIQKRSLVLVTLGVMLMIPAQMVRAWNGTGHEITAYIAFKNLSAEAREKVTALLRAHADYAAVLTQPTTPEGEARDREAFLIAATWPDLVRTPGTPRYRYNHPAWHYIDFPFVVGEISPKPADPQTHWIVGTDPTNAAQAYEKCLAELTNDKLPDAERAVALCWVEHLVGDIHQPLHAISLFSAEYPNGDKGGNSIMVMANEKAINLHSLWDGLEGNYQTPALIEFMGDRLMRKLPLKEVRTQAAVLDFVTWAQASADEARQTVYLQGKLIGIPGEQGSSGRRNQAIELPPRYLETATNLADEKITLGGYRLAAVLNQAFATETRP